MISLLFEHRSEHNQFVMQIGPYKLNSNLVLAPMAGVTDRPFRQLCKNLGAGMAVSEMVSSNSLLWGSKKTQLRINHHFWESYSPDFPVQESPSNYIWDSIMAKLLIDVYK